MDNNAAQIIADRVAGTLDTVQDKALNLETISQQVVSISGKDNHDKVVEAILNSGEIDIDHKIELINIETERYDSIQGKCTERLIRLQNAQTQNATTVSNRWGENWFWVFVAGTVFITLATPGGRKLLTLASERIA